MCGISRGTKKRPITGISQRTRYLNAVNTFKELLSMGVVPIVNENDTVSVSVGICLPLDFEDGSHCCFRR
jgi:hypothetical protein